MNAIISKVTTLRTVYPPIAESEAAALIEDPAVEAHLRTSDFYMIVGRAAARILDTKVDSARNELTFSFVVGGRSAQPVRIALDELPGLQALRGQSYYLEIDEVGRGFRIWDAPWTQAGANVVEWFTAESLLWHRARGRSGIHGLDDVRDLATYDLLYVGISKARDSFDRLFKQGHKARLRILQNEPQRYPGARVSDEIYLLLFRAESLAFRTFELNHSFADEDFQNPLDRTRVVADAEKAFVSLLKPGYNIELFERYPEGKDGLHGQGLTRYGYVIGEQMAFNTAHGQFRGGARPSHPHTNSADAIFVEGDKVQLFRSGVDFPAEDPHP